MVIGRTSNRSTQLPKAAYATPAEPETRSKSGPPFPRTAEIGGGLLVPVQARCLSIGGPTYTLRNTPHLAPQLTTGCALAMPGMGNGFRTGLSIHRSSQNSRCPMAPTCGPCTQGRIRAPQRGVLPTDDKALSNRTSRSYNIADMLLGGLAEPWARG